MEIKMKIGIIYATGAGTTRECASLLAKQFSRHEVILQEIGKDIIDLDAFDVVIVGFSIRMGKPVKAARRFIKANKDKLAGMRSGYFICCGLVDCFEEYAQKALPKELYSSAMDIACFGGSLDHTKFKGFDKLLVRTIRNEILGGGDNADQRSDMALPTIFEINISQFADSVKQKI